MVIELVKIAKQRMLWCLRLNLVCSAGILNKTINQKEFLLKASC